MKMQIGRWGNSLAVRLPKDLVDRYGLAEGGEIDTAGIEAVLQQASDTERERRREQALERIRNKNWSLPADWKNWREEEDNERFGRHFR